MPVTPESRRPPWSNSALALIWALLIVVPLCLLGYAIKKSFYLPEGTPPPPSDLHHANVAFVWLAISLVVLPATGFVLAACTGRKIHATVFGVVAGLAFVVDLLGFVQFHRSHPAPTPAPVVTQCIPRSGGHGCPGG